MVSGSELIHCVTPRNSGAGAVLARLEELRPGRRGEADGHDQGKAYNGEPARGIGFVTSLGSSTSVAGNSSRQTHDRSSLDDDMIDAPRLATEDQAARAIQGIERVFNFHDDSSR